MVTPKLTTLEAINALQIDLNATSGSSPSVIVIVVGSTSVMERMKGERLSGSFSASMKERCRIGQAKAS